MPSPGQLLPALVGAAALAACSSSAPVIPDSPVSLEQQRRPKISDKPARELAFSPDGKLLLAMSAADGTILLWPTHEKGPPRRLAPAAAVIAQLGKVWPKDWKK
jgi:WD40 repeat protein